MRVGLSLLCASLCAAGFAQDKPNFVVIFIDDMGWGDISANGQKNYTTPNIDRLAREGIRFTDFYAMSPGCSPSRAALLTGCYPQRVSIPGVLGPNSKIGLNPSETTLPELLKEQGYATAMYGKWHLGVTPPLSPLNHGFDEFFGLPYSNDMWPGLGKNWKPLMLFEGNEEIEEVKTLEDQDQLTRRYTERAVSFIRSQKDEPFFVYLPHSMVHVPIGVSSGFKGASGHTIYADAVMEIDWSVGQITSVLRELGLDDETMVIFTSDNGPWLPFGDHAGVTGGFREGKGTTFEGGMREPGIFWMPGRIPAGQVSSEIATTMDILPTIARLAGASLPENKIDGHNIWPLLSGAPGAKSPTSALFYYWPGELQAVRVGDWKLHVPHNHRHQEGPPGTDRKSAGQVTRRIGLSLYNLKDDPFETKNLAQDFPSVTWRLIELMNEMRADLGDTGRKMKGSGRRPPGRVLGSARA